MNDVPHDRISDGLRETAESIDVGDADARLIDIRDRARRRTNRRRGALGAVCAVALVGVGAVVVNDADDDGDLIRSADVADEATGEGDDRTVDPAPASTSTTIAPPPPATMVESASTDMALTDGDVAYAEGPQWLVAWRDGFLAGSAMYNAPLLPAELPAEVTALFPQEALDLIVPDLPMPIDEAFERLSMAGFDEQIEAAFAEAPEAFEALYANTDGPSIQFEFSTDGSTWEPIDIALPDGADDIAQLTSVGDRLVIVSQTYPVVPDDDRFPVPEVTVHSTTDLATWTSQPLPMTDRDDLPETVMMHRWPSSIAVQGDRWMLSLEGHIEIDFYSLVPDDVRDRMDREGWGVMPGPDGMIVELLDENGVSETIEFTYDELGVSPELAADLDDGGFSAEIWTAGWDGTPTPATDPRSSDDPGGGVIAVGAGFMTNGGTPSYSIDGASWSAMPGAPENAWISSTMSIDGGVLAFTDGVSGPTIYRIDAALGWTPIEIPGAPERFHPAFGDGRAHGAIVVDASIANMPIPEPVEVSVPVGDLTLVFDDDTLSQTYRVVDAAGAVLVTETWSYDDTREDIPETGPFEFLRYEESGNLTVVSPDDGTVLLELSLDDLSAAYDEAYGYDEMTMEEPPEMELWVLASADGTDWLVERLEVDPMFWHVQTARNGSTVLVSTGSDWLTYELP